MYVCMCENVRGFKVRTAITATACRVPHNRRLKLAQKAPLHFHTFGPQASRLFFANDASRGLASHAKCGTP